MYRWIEGTRVNNYATSAKVWLEFTQRPAFVEEMQTLINDQEKSNEDRAAAVE
jgi:hypothetical protein